MTLPRPTPLHWALLISIGVHLLLLVMRLVDPGRFERMFGEQPLEVVLVNARSNEPPPVAQALAQANLAGGGEAERGRATSPLPPSAAMAVGDAPDDARRRVDELREAQQQLLTQIRRELATMPVPPPPHEGATAADLAQQERQRALLRQLAEIERRVNDDNARPRKKYVSPATREVAYAAYYDRLRRRIEDRGTRDFPTLDGRKLYGELTMNITVDSAGRVVDAEVVRASASRALDQRAVAIVRAASPFGAFSNEMRQQTDQLVVTSRFRFTRDVALETTLSNR